MGRAAAATQVKVEKPADKDTTPAADSQGEDEETSVAAKATQGGPTWRGPLLPPLMMKPRGLWLPAQGPVETLLL